MSGSINSYAGETVNVIAASTSAVSLHAKYGTIQDVTLTAATVAVTLPAADVGHRLTVVLRQDATGGRLVTWAANVKWPGGTTPTLSTAASAADVFQFVCVDGANWLGQMIGAAGSTTAAKAVVNMVGGATIVDLPSRAPTALVSPNQIGRGRLARKAYANMAGIRFWFAGLGFSELAADNETYVQAHIEYLGVRYPLTFNGDEFGMLSRFGLIRSDPASCDVPLGATYYTVCSAIAPNNAGNFNPLNGYTTLAADAAISATNVQINHLPTFLRPTERFHFSGAGAEVGEVYRVSGTAAPYTAYLKKPLAAAHLTGVLFGQSTWASAMAYSDRQTGGDTANAASFDQSQDAFTVTAPTGGTTLAAAANAGDTVIKLVGSGFIGKTFTLDTAGLQETITVRSVVGIANPYTAYLTAPLAFAHASGASVLNTVAQSAVPAPVAITCDHATNAAASVVLIGDSILVGQGNYGRTNESWATMALDNTNPVLNMAKSGESVQQYIANFNGSQRRRLAEFGVWALINYGTNDIYGGRSLAQWTSDMTTLIGWLKARGIKIALTTLTPRTNSSSSLWDTTGGQTVTNGTFEAVRVAANTLIRSGFNGLADMPCVDTAAIFETSLNSGIWIADTTTGPYTVDGLHFSMAGHVLAQNAITPALFA